MNETKPLLLDAGLTRFVEKQMRNWEISRAQRREVQPTRQIEDFITIANMVGAGGREVAQAVAAELGWPMYDRDLLTSMARGDESRAGLYRSVDERELGWLEMTLRSVMEEAMRKNDYFHRLTTTVLGLARQRPAVFVGRGADHLAGDLHPLRPSSGRRRRHRVRHEVAERDAFDGQAHL
ncbi:MAG TPA: cytidylate kinase family protein, partial [Phycisphaerae bacterium]|nr:cytidylate kinase family protein [Phycisphaerae bacterium]